MMTSNKDDNAVYLGIPLLNHQDYDVTLDRISSTNDGVQSSTVSTNTRSSSQGLLAFIVGVFLASIGWVANQGWTVVSLLLFGEFSWSSIATTLPHILLCIFGALVTAIAFWTAFQRIFSHIVFDEDDDDEKQSSISLLQSYKRDMSYALQDLGILGFVVGNLLCQTFLMTFIYKPLFVIGIEYKDENVAIDGATVVFVLLWMLSTKLRDYSRAVKKCASICVVEDVNDDSLVYAAARIPLCSVVKELEDGSSSVKYAHVQIV